MLHGVRLPVVQFGLHVYIRGVGLKHRNVSKFPWKPLQNLISC